VIIGMKSCDYRNEVIFTWIKSCYNINKIMWSYESIQVISAHFHEREFAKVYGVFRRTTLPAFQQSADQFGCLSFVVHNRLLNAAADYRRLQNPPVSYILILITVVSHCVHPGGMGLFQINHCRVRNHVVFHLCFLISNSIGQNLNLLFWFMRLRLVLL